MIDRSIFHNKTVAFHTLGCKLNFSETSTIARALTEDGFTKVDFNQVVDMYVINTCSVTDMADKKCRTIIKKAIKQNPQAFVVVTGCFAQLKPDSIAKIPGVDLVLGSNEKFNISDYIDALDKRTQVQVITGKINRQDNFNPSYSFGDRTRCFLKIQDGCDYYCTYCTIPFARGKSRNDTIANTVAQAQKVASEGAKEIILTGVNIGDFGQGGNENFFQLIQELDKVEGIERYRISSIEPNLLTDEIIEFVVNSKKFMPHFHIPLQSGSDKVLGLMKRKYKTALFQQRIEKIKSLVPHAFIGVDVIVGSRGETDEDFRQAHEFIQGLDISQLHVFTYSERPGTKALEIEEVSTPEQRKLRSQVLLELSDKKTRQFYQQFENTTQKVLFEASHEKGFMFGFTENYLKVKVPYNQDLINSIHQVELQKFDLSEMVINGKII